PALADGKETILVVEDDDPLRGVIRGVLRRRGYDVLEARDAQEALDVCRRHPGVIALLLTDVVMPRMSGPELARRAIEHRPRMRVLCMSGYTDDRIAPHGVSGEEIPCLKKPFTPASLSARIREVLDDASQ